MERFLPLTPAPTTSAAADSFCPARRSGLYPSPTPCLKNKNYALPPPQHSLYQG